MTAALQADFFAAEDDNEVSLDSNGSAHSAPNQLTQSDFIEQLLGLYRLRENDILQTSEFIRQAYAKGVMSYFESGMRLKHDGNANYSLASDAEAAKIALRIEFWNRVLRETEVFDAMPAKKREEARKQFNGVDCPPFDESTVRPTVENLLGQRSNFFAERVDLIFQGLSKSHITNQPQGFSKKLILANVFDKFGYQSDYKCGLLSDLRGVVGRLSRRGEPTEYATRELLARLYNGYIGKKVSIDGGAFFITVYKVGTVHFEVAPEVAIELNSVLAGLYPSAIPSQFRTAPKSRKHVTYDLSVERLSMGTVALLAGMRAIRQPTNDQGVHYTLSSYGKDKADVAKALSVIESIGGTHRNGSSGDTIFVEFDYHPHSAIEQVIFTAAVPETVSYQYYPTKNTIGAEAADRLDVQDGMSCAEPSAGTGDLAQYLPKETTLCIELAQVRVKVLEAKGFKTIKADFLEWVSDNPSYRVQRVLMNPPFSKGRALAHLKAASGMLTTDGRLVAILPASMINTTPLEGFEHEWSEVFVDQFEGTAVRVVILTAYPNG